MNPKTKIPPSQITSPIKKDETMKISFPLFLVLNALILTFTQATYAQEDTVTVEPCLIVLKKFTAKTYSNKELGEIKSGNVKNLEAMILDLSKIVKRLKEKDKKNDSDYKDLQSRKKELASYKGLSLEAVGKKQLSKDSAKFYLAREKILKPFRYIEFVINSIKNGVSPKISSLRINRAGFKIKNSNSSSDYALTITGDNFRFIITGLENVERPIEYIQFFGNIKPKKGVKSYHCTIAAHLSAYAYTIVVGNKSDNIYPDGQAFKEENGGMVPTGIKIDMLASLAALMSE